MKKATLAQSLAQSFAAWSLFCACWLSVLDSKPASARWATEQDVIGEMDKKLSIQVKKEGTASSTYQLRFKILKEEAFKVFSPFQFTYPAGVKRAKILLAQVQPAAVAGQLPQKPFSLKPSDIEDKPVASESVAGSGFDETHQISVSFPKLQVGATVILHFQLETYSPLFKNFYGEKIDLGYPFSLFQTVHSSLEIHSEAPLFAELTDPEHVFTYKASPHLIQASSKRPFITAILMEDNVSTDPKDPELKQTFLEVATLKPGDWGALAARIAPEYEVLLQERLPKLFDEMAKETARLIPASQPLERVDHVIAKLAETLNYFGTWTSRHGRILPKHFSETAQSKYGDCKDYAAVTVALLRKLGLTAAVAMIDVNRTVAEIKNERATLPREVFNHAVVYAQINGQDHFFDPTWKLGPAGQLLPHLADRPALIIDVQHPRMLRTPPLDPKNSGWQLQSRLDFSDPEQALMNSTLRYTGTYPAHLTGMELSYDKAIIQDSILEHVFSNTSDRSLLSFSDFNLTSRVIHDLNFTFSLAWSRTVLATTQGDLVYFSPDKFTRLWEHYLVRQTDRVGDLDVQLGLVNYQRDLTLLNTHKKLAPLPAQSACEIDRPWIYAARKISMTQEGDLQVAETLLAKQLVLPRALVISPEYKEFMNELKNCIGPLGIILKQ